MQRRLQVTLLVLRPAVPHWFAIAVKIRDTPVGTAALDYPRGLLLCLKVIDLLLLQVYSSVFRASRSS
jgi:hypothetical protein